MKLKHIVIAAFAVCILMGAFRGKHDHNYPATALSVVPLNGAAGTRTFTIANLAGYATIQFWMNFDYTAKAGTVTTTCTGGPTAVDNDYTLTVCDPVAATGTCVVVSSGIMTSEGSLSADTKWDTRLGVRGVDNVSCVVSHDGTPGATDLISVKYIKIAE